MGTVVVRARFAYETTDDPIRWEVKEGDLGVLTWVPHKRHPQFLEPRVIWDRDPKKNARRIIGSSVTVVGLQRTRIRMMLIDVPE